MQARHGSVLETLRRVQEFLDANQQQLGAINPSARKNLDDAVTAISSHATNQASGSIDARGGTALKQKLRLALRQYHMQPIAIVARRKLRAVAEFKALTMPAVNANVSQLVAHAAAMGEAAKKHEQIFLDAGLSVDF